MADPVSALVLFALLELLGLKGGGAPGPGPQPPGPGPSPGPVPPPPPPPPPPVPGPPAPPPGPPPPFPGPVPGNLPPFPGPGWTPYEPPPADIVARAQYWNPILWDFPSRSIRKPYVTEMYGGRWVTFRAAWHPGPSGPQTFMATEAFRLVSAPPAPGPMPPAPGPAPAPPVPVPPAPEPGPAPPGPPDTSTWLPVASDMHNVPAQYHTPLVHQAEADARDSSIATGETVVHTIIDRGFLFKKPSAGNMWVTKMAPSAGA